jgi:hypothetical protein
MRTLLRNTKAGFYFQGVDDWTKNPDDAFDFKLTERVIRFVRDARLETTDLELVLAFDNPNFNITLPIDERFTPYASRPGKKASRIFS